jgi:replicative DNA helicase
MNIYRVFVDGLFNRDDWFLEALTTISPEQIPDQMTKVIYRVLQHSYYSDGQLPNLQTFPDMVMRRFSEQAAKKFIEYLFTHDTSVPAYTEFRYAINEIKREGKSEQIRMNIAKAVDLLKNKKIEGITETLTEGLDSFQSDGASEADARRGARTTLARYKEPVGPRIKSGIPELDVGTGGGRKGELWIWAAYTGEGKTQAMKEIAYNAIVCGRNVAWITLEMEREEMEEMFIIRHSHKFREGGIDARDTENRVLSENEYEAYELAAMDWGDNDAYGALHIWKPSRHATLRTVETKLQGLKNLMGAEIVFLDYAEIISASRKREQYRIEIKDKMVMLKRLASDLDVWMVTGHQINRSGREAAEKRSYYLLSDLAESSAVEQNASVVAWSLYTLDMKERNRLKFGTMKARKGRTADRGHEVREDFAHGRIYFDLADDGAE